MQSRDESLCGGSFCRREGIQCNQGTKACLKELLIGKKEYSASKEQNPE